MRGARLGLMEYEILEEDMLFDDSTNPSLEPAGNHAPLSPTEREEKRKLQKAELIPEEEHQLA